MVRKSAFTLIELIFAIVVIAISVMSLPMMNQSISKGLDSGIVQEAIFASSTELNSIATSYWDKNSFEPYMANLYSRVIDIGSQCNNTPNSSRYRLKPGHIVQPLHRKCLTSSTIVPSNAGLPLSSEKRVVDNFKHSYLDISLLTNVSQDGYKYVYQSEANITTSPIFNASAQVNMKKITVTTKIKNPPKIVTKLFTYSANIGEADYYKVRY